MTLAARVIVADPGWKFGDKLPGKGRGAEKHYRVMELHEIMRHELPPLEDDAILFLWRVASMPLEALKVCEAWGFKPKAEMVWVKTKSEEEDDPEDEKSKKMGMGHYVRNEHEVAIIATRGSFKVADKGVRSTFRAPLGKHSEKPAKFFELVERMCGVGPFVELFGRKARVGWHVYGDEIPQGYVWTPADPSNPHSQKPVEKLLDAAEKRELAMEDKKEIEAAAAESRCKGPNGSHRFHTVANSEGQRQCGDCGRWILPPVGVNPVAALLLEQPVAKILPLPLKKSNGGEVTVPGEPTRADHVKRGIVEGLIKDEPIDIAWPKLLLAAPAGWFKKKTVEAKAPVENFSDLVLKLNARGVAVTLLQVCDWSPFRRDVARAWLEQGGERPDFISEPSIPHVTKVTMELQPDGRVELVPGSGIGCAACDRGVAVEGKEYLHTGMGTLCSKASEASSPQAPTPARRSEEAGPVRASYEF